MQSKRGDAPTRRICMWKSTAMHSRLQLWTRYDGRGIHVWGSRGLDAGLQERNQAHRYNFANHLPFLMKHAHWFNHRKQ